MALNWAMIASDGKSPVPLPGEKILLEQDKVSLILDMGGGYPGNAETLKADGEGKFQQPWFGANYYQAVVTPVLNGGLPAPGQLKVTFKEGGGFKFSTVYKNLMLRLFENEGTAPVEHTEPLPMYTPRQDNSSSAQTSTSSCSNVVSSGAPLNSLEPPADTTAPRNISTSTEARPPPVAPDELPPAYDEVITR
ncbi:WW domain binding protein-2 [Rhizophagus clarus]|uniref:WW domain binding protein-2 n=1 Tax=Rhizophagus clarus TaxID=94130 RepID=A0A8H3LGN2_9GLOM|nr:WW domain binding protein-2 [Rhizophagus clarus]